MPPAQVQNEISSRKIRCVLVHEHLLLRQGLRRLLEDEPDLEFVGEAGNLAGSLRTILESRPDVVIADASTFGLSASEAELLFAHESPHTKLVFLNKNGCTSSIFGEGDGAEDSPAQQTPMEEVVKMVRDVCGRSDWKLRVDQSSDHAASPAAGRPLTAREKEVLKLLAEGKTVRAAATDLGLSSKTVDAHKFNLMRKLNIHNKAGLVMWAIQRRLVKIPAGF